MNEIKEDQHATRSYYQTTLKRKPSSLYQLQKGFSLAKNPQPIVKELDEVQTKF